jgi:hypothetical protein
MVDKAAEAAALAAVIDFSTAADSVVDEWLKGDGSGSEGEDDEAEVERRGVRVGLGAKYLPHSKVAFTAEQKLMMKLKHKNNYDEELAKEEEVVAEQEDSRTSTIKTTSRPESKPIIPAAEKKGRKRKREDGKAAGTPTEDPKLVEYEKKLVAFLLSEGGSCKMTSTKPCVGNDCPIPKGCGKLKKFVTKRTTLFNIDDEGLLTYIGEAPKEEEKEGQKIEREDEDGNNEKEETKQADEEPAEEKSDDMRQWSEKDRRKIQAPPLAAKKAKKEGGRKKTRSRQKNLKKDKRDLSKRPTYLTPGADDYHSDYVQAR